MDKCVVRQAIKEQKTDSIVGYELLIQSDEDSLYNPSSDSIAANAITAFLSENSTRIFHEMYIYDIYAVPAVSEYAETIR